MGTATMALGFALAGCGGGGGPTDSGIPVNDTILVSMGTGTSHTALNLSPATTYHWKVIASDQTTSYQSMTYSFTTAVN